MSVVFESSVTAMSGPEETQVATPDFAGRGRVGLTNLGNTCFMNASLQCLAHTMSLTLFTLEQSFAKDIEGRLKPEITLLQNWLTLLDKMWREDAGRSIAPSDLVRCALQHAGEQGDSHEFIVGFLDAIHRAISHPSGISINANIPQPIPPAFKAYIAWVRHFEKESSELAMLTYGQYAARSEGNTCGHVSYNYDPFSTLVLPIPSQQGQSSSVTVADCVRAFTAPEQLGASELWNCEDCKASRVAIRTFRFWRLPRVLIVSLKRFTNLRVRLNSVLNLTSPENRQLDLSPYCEEYARISHEDAQYKLVGFTCHFGSSAAGHYTAACRNIDGQWYYYDDSRVSPMGDADFARLGAAAYTLFYER